MLMPSERNVPPSQQLCCSPTSRHNLQLDQSHPKEGLLSSIQRIWQWIKVSPVTVTFLLSITLSLASSSYRASMNPDGMVHIMAGRIFIEEGFTEALKFFDWPFFSILIGIVGYVLPISYEAAGRLLNILFLAGTCSLLVRVTQR